MDQQFFIIILVIFLLTSNFSKIIKDIIKGLIYLFLSFAVLKIINPTIENKMKNNVSNIINSDQGLFTNGFSNIASYLKTFIKTSIKNKDVVALLNTNSTEPTI
jgi:hypothetical protein